MGKANSGEGEEDRRGYAERYRLWKLRIRVVPGTRPGLVRWAEAKEAGWGNSWTSEMDEGIGSEFSFKCEAGEGGGDGIQLDQINFSWSYSVFEVVR